MGDNPTQQKIAALHRRVDEMRRQAGAGPHRRDEVMEEACQELQNTLEELRVAEEELQARNDELAATQADLEAERERYRELFEQAPDGYVVTDPEGVVREANRAAAALLNTW